jgi:ectoine hydroxylase-related dioxygenase (phytanoyl-CoA dioxygenase family)
MPSLGETLDRDGYALIAGALTAAECESLRQALADIAVIGGKGGQRHILRRPEVAGLCGHPAICKAVEEVLGSGAFAYKATLFDKTADSNWKVAWHQDLSLPVRGAARPPDWSGWSVKDDVLYAQPPTELMARMLAVRVHLDGCEAENGALRVIPGSHVAGRLNPEQAAIWRGAKGMVTCSASTGDLLLMRPLLLHASSASTTPVRRRVVHLEFAAEELPAGLEWADRLALAPCSSGSA